MSAEVGGELEKVPPRRSLFGPDYGRLAVLLALSVAIHAWLVSHTAVPARDSLGYARIALNLDHPNAEPGPPRQRIEVVREAIHPPAYPVVVCLAERLLRPVTNLSLAERCLLAAQLANAAAAVLLVVPMYLTGRILFGRNVGFAAALLFQVLPVPARVTSDGLSEGLYLLTMAVAVLLGVRAARRPGVGGFLTCGLATGLSYLVRPEGLLTAGGVGAVVVAAGLTRRWPREHAMGWLTALMVGVALVAVPYMVLIGKITNKTTGDALLNWLLKGEDGPPIYQGGPGAKAAAGGSGPLFAEWWNPADDHGKSRALWAFAAVWKESGKSLHYAVGLFGIVALVARRRQLLHPDAGMWVVVGLAALNWLLLVYLAARVGYVSERHTVPFAMLFCTLGAAGFGPYARWVASWPLVRSVVIWPRAAPATLFLIMILSALPYTMKTMHPQRVGHKYAGFWLAEHMAEADHLKDPLAWAEWYAGRTLYSTPRYHNRPEYVWVVWERGKDSPHSRIPLWEEARWLVANRKPVYQWPEDAGPMDAAVEVYKLEFEEAEVISKLAEAERAKPRPGTGTR